ncbi:MAG TPA: glycoside hydrolase family 43 protein [Burkholderiales bacterium]|nr:glycoside hydrolase family 43 protein [Burkholderiales bacterium]
MQDEQLGGRRTDARLSAKDRVVAFACAVALAVQMASGVCASLATNTPEHDKTPGHEILAPYKRSAHRELDKIRRADPSVIQIGSIYCAVESDSRNLYVRTAKSPEALNDSEPIRIWGGMRHVWAPELVKIGDRYYVYFAAGDASGLGHQRMYVISSDRPTEGYSDTMPLELPDDKWAIDGAPFQYGGQWWFVWSGWEGDSNVEQNLYLARMTDPIRVEGPRYLISQPREWWERVVGNPYVNEGPEPIVDPAGQLHIVYSANGSWSADYCLVDLRLRGDGDPSRQQDWYKSNGCLLGANSKLLMDGVQPVAHASSVGHHSFALVEGNIDSKRSPTGEWSFFYHAVPQGMPVRWDNRYWYAGSFAWWEGAMYCRDDAVCDVGWRPRFDTTPDGN